MQNSYKAFSAHYTFDALFCNVASGNEYSTVRFDKNNYSVPADIIGKEVTVKAF